MNLFKGEVLAYPCALEYSGNDCSNGCAYCFASVRKTGRVADVSTLANFCLGKSKSHGLEAWFFNRGYPICVSNRSDPFATSNCVGRMANTQTVLQLLDMVPNGVVFQTKGLSRGADFSMLDGFKKRNVVMYITIDTMDEAICKRIEPGAPLPKARIELAKYAKDRGWHVVIGINPCYGAWMSDEAYKALVMELKGVADGYYFQELLLKHQDLAAMDEARRARLPMDEVGDALHSGNLVGNNRVVLRRAIMPIRYADVFFNYAPYPCYALAKMRSALGCGLNQVQDFMNFAIEEKMAGRRDVFTFDDFLAVMFKGNEELATVRNKAVSSYIVGCSMPAYKAHSYARNADSFEALYRTCWNDRRMHPSPQSFPCVKVDGEDEMGNVKIRITDEFLKIAGLVLGERR